MIMLNVAGYCSASCGPILNIVLLGGGEDPYLKVNLYQILCQPNQIWYRLYFLLNSLLDESISDSISHPRHLAAWVKIKNRCAAPLCWKRNTKKSFFNLTFYHVSMIINQFIVDPIPNGLRQFLLWHLKGIKFRWGSNIFHHFWKVLWLCTFQTYLG